ncbi:MAG: hypothetical protein II743_01305 [Lachnospiraceae bacterium]|nr:hypothetical protein [Lachnospiraceae bacterium]
MFIFDFLVGSILEQVLDWAYGCVVSLFNELFAMMNGMGTELFELSYVKALILFFKKLGWALYVVGIIVAVFEAAMEYQRGRGNVTATLMNVIKGFFAVNLFHIVPITLYAAAVKWQGMLGKEISGLPGSSQVGASATELLNDLTGMPQTQNLVIGLFFVIAIGYSVVKVFFANVKRGGILLVQIAVGSLHVFSVPRGYLDGFVGWCKRVIGLCLTAFLQTLVLTIGLRIFIGHPVLGTGLLLASTEVPRICEQFGLDTSAKANVMSGLYAARTAIQIGKAVASAAA